MGKKTKPTLCPRCKINYYSYDIPIKFPALSRRGYSISICNTCGMQEALIDRRKLKPDKIEKDFIKLIQANYFKRNKQK